MKQAIRIATLALTLSLPLLACERQTTLKPVATSSADQFEDAMAAYDSGDFTTALKLWRPLAEQGNAASQHNLGLMYSKGQGVKQDYAEALKWYRLAANQGYARALNNLGNMYLEGRGVQQDYIQAYKWFSLSFTLAMDDEGQELALANMMTAQITGRMTKSDKDEAHRQGEEWIAKDYKPSSP